MNRDMLVLVNHNPRLNKIYLERMKEVDHDQSRMGEILDNMYVTLVVPDPVLSVDYERLKKIQPVRHKVVETAATHMIKNLITVLGWRGFIEGLELYAKNKQEKNLVIGLPGDVWTQIAKRAKAMPRNPQM